MHIVGTAGHVDHGTSSLVCALTGTDPDRWFEEQRRGMPLDLGFAHLAFDDGVEAGIVDVPRHERFLHNMLAGAAGMELVLLVIAANEGPQRQTFEHLAILAYLNVRTTLIVMTKCDLLEPGEDARAASRVREALHGTIAQNAALFCVSTLAGTGIEALRAGIHDALVALPERAPNAPAYLPIDRVFALAGHGTIVTGTLMQGRISIGDTLELSPLARGVRVRSLQVFGQKRERVTGGTRVAINVPGVETGEIRRGAVLASPQFPLSVRLVVTFRPLPDALDMLKRRTPVRAYIGSAEILATLVFDTVPSTLEDVMATLLLRAPTVAVPGAPFVVRRVSPMNMLGGGTIAAIASAATSAIADDENERAQGAVLAALRATRLTGSTAAQVSAATNLSQEQVQRVLIEIVTDGRAIAVTKPQAYVDREIAGDLLERALEHVAARQRERPWLMGLTSIALAQAVGEPEPALVRILAAYVDAGAIAYRKGYYATLDFQPRLAPEQRKFFDAVFVDKSASATTPVAFDEVRALIRASRVADITAAFDTLVASGAVVKVGDFMYREAYISATRKLLEDTLRASGHITVAEFRTLTGSSRKYAVPLLEYFDSIGVTIRSGDVRTLRRRSA